MTNKNNTQSGAELADGGASKLSARHLHQSRVSPISHLYSWPFVALFRLVDTAGDFEGTSFGVNSSLPPIAKSHEPKESVMSGGRRGRFVLMEESHHGLQEGEIRPGVEVTLFDSGFQTAELVSIQILSELLGEVGDIGKERFTQSVGRSHNNPFQGSRDLNYNILYNKNNITVSMVRYV